MQYKKVFNPALFTVVMLIGSTALSLASIDIHAMDMSSFASTCMSWTFGRTDGSVIASDIRLNSDGSISGYHHYNESAWRMEGGDIAFINGGGDVSTRFGDASMVGGHLLLKGTWGGIQHRLKCN